MTGLFGPVPVASVGLAALAVLPLKVQADQPGSLRE